MLSLLWHTVKKTPLYCNIVYLERSFFSRIIKYTCNKCKANISDFPLSGGFTSFLNFAILNLVVQYFFLYQNKAHLNRKYYPQRNKIRTKFFFFFKLYWRQNTNYLIPLCLLNSSRMIWFNSMLFLKRIFMITIYRQYWCVCEMSWKCNIPLISFQKI